MENGVSKSLKSEHWRGLTPLLLMLLTLMSGITGTLLTWGINDIRADIRNISDKVVDHDIRLATIEANRFTSSDANNLVNIILDQLPPKWLVDKVNKNEEKIDKIYGSK